MFQGPYDLTAGRRFDAVHLAEARVSYTGLAPNHARQPKLGAYTGNARESHVIVSFGTAMHGKIYTRGKRGTVGRCYICDIEGEELGRQAVDRALPRGAHRTKGVRY